MAEAYSMFQPLFFIEKELLLIQFYSFRLYTFSIFLLLIDS